MSSGSNGGVDMERVFFRLHEKLILSVTRMLDSGSLRVVEALALLNAVLCLSVLVYLHLTFVTAGSNCVVQGIREPLASTDLAFLHVGGIWSKLAEIDSDGARAVAELKDQGLVELKELRKTWLSDPTYLYSREKGFLLLEPAVRAKHNVTQMNITLDFDCIQPGRYSFVSFVLDNFVGYDTVVTNTLLHATNGSGFLFSSLSKDLVDLQAVAYQDTKYADPDATFADALVRFLVFKIGILVTTLFLFFITTTLVHHTLRETQEKMLQFTVELQARIEGHESYYNLIVNHVVNSLVFVPIMVGMLFFLFEFFNDQLLAFMILALVWVCELYSVISLRTRVSIRVFPSLFFVYFSTFHLYFFSFPSGFSYLALTTVVIFLHHAMICFWNRFELPAFRRGDVNLSRPRQLVLWKGDDGLPPSLAYHALVGESTSPLHEQESEENEVQGAPEETGPSRAAQRLSVDTRPEGNGQPRRRKRQTLHTSPSLFTACT